MVTLTKKKNIIAKNNKGIIEPQNMTTQELLDTLTRYDSRRKIENICSKLSKLGLETIAKI